MAKYEVDPLLIEEIEAALDRATSQETGARHCRRV